jgi:hypothetical protein
MKTSILVFASGSPANPMNIADGEDLNMLQGVGAGQIGYSRLMTPQKSPRVEQCSKPQYLNSAAFFILYQKSGVESVTQKRVAI